MSIYGGHDLANAFFTVVKKGARLYSIILNTGWRFEVAMLIMILVLCMNAKIKMVKNQLLIEIARNIKQNYLNPFK